MFINFLPQYITHAFFIVTYCNFYCFHVLFSIYHKISIHDIS